MWPTIMMKKTPSTIYHIILYWINIVIWIKISISYYLLVAKDFFGKAQFQSPLTAPALSILYMNCTYTV